MGESTQKYRGHFKCIGPSQGSLDAHAQPYLEPEATVVPLVAKVSLRFDARITPLGGSMRKIVGDERVKTKKDGRKVGGVDLQRSKFGSEAIM